MVEQNKVLEALKAHFNLDSFRGDQERVITHILSKKSALTVMPTGTGKSLCYQLPTFLNDGLTLVVSPLIALMKDQVDAARKVGLKATFINSSMTGEERSKAYKKLANQDYNFLLVTPERFQKKEFVEAIKKNKISLLAIDEAHCISQWGHDFRPDYSRLGDIKKNLGDPPTLALTATATPEVQKDILDILEIPEDHAFISSMARPELELYVDDIFGLETKVQKIIFYRHHTPGPCIIYFSLVSTLEKVSQELYKLNVEHGVYHGQMHGKDRKRQQDSFLKGKQELMLATPAFGLGINKSDVRSVIHAEIPGSIEAYYQEVGRAGRDGKPSKCILLYDKDDVSIHMDFIKWSSPAPAFIHSVYHLVKDNPLRYQQEGADYLRGELNFYNRKDFRVETALRLLERWGSLLPDQVLRHKAIQEPNQYLLDVDLHEKKIKAQNKKLLEILQWAESEACRKHTIYTYFGEHSEPCGQCDHCVEAKA